MKPLHLSNITYCIIPHEVLYRTNMKITIKYYSLTFGYENGFVLLISMENDATITSLIENQIMQK